MLATAARQLGPGEWGSNRSSRRSSCSTCSAWTGSCCSGCLIGSAGVCSTGSVSRPGCADGRTASQRVRPRVEGGCGEGADALRHGPQPAGDHRWRAVGDQGLGPVLRRRWCRCRCRDRLGGVPDRGDRCPRGPCRRCRGHPRRCTDRRRGCRSRRSASSTSPPAPRSMPGRRPWAARASPPPSPPSSLPATRCRWRDRAHLRSRPTRFPRACTSPVSRCTPASSEEPARRTTTSRLTRARR